MLRQEVLAPPPTARHNLPALLTSFLGREQELTVLEGLVGEVRMVTLTGPGGAGKTRLALEFATSAVERFGDGVWLADLAGIAEAELMPSVVMATLTPFGTTTGLRPTRDITKPRRAARRRGRPCAPRAPSSRPSTW